jgi:hypothetical protein
MRFAFCFTGLVAVLSVVAACSSTSGGQVASGGGDVKHQSASTGGLRAYQELKLKNGLRVLLLEDSSLPYLSLQMLIQTGSASDPDGSAGLSSLVAELLQQGTQKRDAQKLAEDLARIGASFGTSVNEDFTSVSMSGLSLYGDEFIKNFGRQRSPILRQFGTVCCQ